MFQQHCCCLLQVQNNPIIESTYNDSLQVPDKLLAVATMHYVWRLCHGLVPGFAASMCNASFALSECHFTSLLMILVAYQWIRCPVFITYSATAEVSAAAERGNNRTPNELGWNQDNWQSGEKAFAQSEEGIAHRCSETGTKPRQRCWTYIVAMATT